MRVDIKVSGGLIPLVREGRVQLSELHPELAKRVRELFTEERLKRSAGREKPACSADTCVYEIRIDPAGPSYAIDEQVLDPEMAELIDELQPYLK